MAMLAGQMRGQGEAFLEEGGFRERLTQARLESRDAPAADAPTCPLCDKPMRQRTARKGPHAGEPFWSCSGYPECRGTRPVEAPRTQDPGPKTQAPAS
jgi:ssDNA-binding Zn-finger/Zn-ribbon topoisomerase 1